MMAFLSFAMCSITNLRGEFVLCVLLLSVFGNPAALVSARVVQPSGQIELVRATRQGVTLQLVIAERDFMKDDGGMTFPGCRLTTVPGRPRLPMQSALIGVPADVAFEVRVLQHEFRVHRNLQSVGRARFVGRGAVPRSGFLPENVAELRETGWIRENRVLPIQLNPVQYNFATGEVRLSHRLVVEVAFRPLKAVNVDIDNVDVGLRKESQTSHSLSSNALRLTENRKPESPAYAAMLRNLLINPQTAMQWRASGVPRVTERHARFQTAPTKEVSLLPSPSAPANTPFQNTFTAARYKVLVTHDGMHHITGRQLAETTGIDIRTIVPATLNMSNNGRQIPIFVRGEADGRFDAHDEIVFYGQRLSGEQTYFHPFSDENVYWLTWNGTRGLRMTSIAVPARVENPQVYQHFLTRAHFEQDNHFRRFPNANLPEGSDYEEIGAGLQTRNFVLTELPQLPSDSWFWKSLPTGRTEQSEPKRAVALPFTLTGVAGTDRLAALRVNFYGRSDTEHRIDLWLNDTLHFEESRWEGETAYQFEEPALLQSYLKNGSNTLRALLPSTHLDIVMVNWLEVDYWRTFDAHQDILPFAITPRADETGKVNPHFEVQLNNFSSPDIEIYGVDGTRYVGLNPLINQDINEETNTYRVVFQGEERPGFPGEELPIQYIALTREQFRQPNIVEVTPSELGSPHNGADYLIITDTPFLPDVQPLADFRAQHGNLRAKVVNVQQIYDEFSHGILNPYAIREFLKYAYEHWQPPAPTYVLLVGDTHFDLKNETSFVPTLQVQIPGYGATATDHGFVTFRGDDTFPDMFIGRIPARNRVDVRVFVERAIHYETQAEVGPWQKRLLMLAGTEWIFHTQTNWLIGRNNLAATYEVKDIFAPTHERQAFADVETRVRSPIARRVIDGFNEGAALVNYIGHGGGGIWASSRMLDLEDAEQNLTNIEQLPFVISMTCFTGFFDGSQSCLAEELLRSQNGGAIAVIGGTSIGLLEGDYALNREIFDVIFDASEDAAAPPVRHLGAILAQAKTQFLINAPAYFDLAEVFTLFGDPGTRLRLPHTQIAVTADVGENAVAVSGTLANRHFSGQAEITVVPKDLQAASSEQGTVEQGTIQIGRRGLQPRTVSVRNGQFNADILLPANSHFDAADVRAYAWNADEDAVGSVSYTALEQYLTNIRISPYPVEPHQTVHVYGEVKDERAIDSLTLFWSLDGVAFETIPVVPQPSVGEVATYRTAHPIPGYPARELIDYYLVITLQDGRTLQTEIERYEFGEVHVDVSVLEQTLAWDTTASPFLLSAKIINLGAAPVQNVPVHFLQTTATGAPEETVLSAEELQNAQRIGEVQVLKEILPGGEVVASVPWQPAPGNYLVTVVVDRPSAEQPKGVIVERRERNNTAARLFASNWMLLTPGQGEVVSGDGRLRLSLPEGSIQTPTLMTLETLAQQALRMNSQPDIVPLSDAYELGLEAQKGLRATVAFGLSEGSAQGSFIYSLDEITGNWIRVGDETRSEAWLSTQVALPGTFALLSHTDRRPPSLNLTVENQGFIDGDYISDTPTISARIEDANGVDTRPANIVLTKNGARVPQEDYVVAASPVNGNVVLITYTPILEAGEWTIRLQAQDANGNPAATGRTATVAGAFEIQDIANFPNPFTPRRGTDFAYYLTESADEVTLKIYTVTGRLITAVETLDAEVAYNEFHYDGLDADGEPLANGVYLYQFTARQGETRRKKVGKLVVVR